MPKSLSGPRPRVQTPGFPDFAIGKVPSAWAQDELRSVNGQVEYLLRQAVQKRKGSTGTPSPNPAEPDKAL
jgi:hypothetical protein